MIRSLFCPLYVCTIPMYLCMYLAIFELNNRLFRKPPPPLILLTLRKGAWQPVLWGGWGLFSTVV